LLGDTRNEQCSAEYPGTDAQQYERRQHGGVRHASLATDPPRHCPEDEREQDAREQREQHLERDDHDRSERDGQERKCDELTTRWTGSLFAHESNSKQSMCPQVERGTVREAK
jgi:hypothetical protein